MILLIDNYDSFSYNLYQLVGGISPDIQVVRNDAVTAADIRHLAPTPVGMQVTATATLREVERRKMWFDIEVHDEKGKCGEGSHLRIMVPQKDRSQS